MEMRRAIELSFGVASGVDPGIHVLDGSLHASTGRGCFWCGFIKSLKDFVSKKTLQSSSSFRIVRWYNTTGSIIRWKMSTRVPRDSIAVLFGLASNVGLAGCQIVMELRWSNAGPRHYAHGSVIRGKVYTYGLSGLGKEDESTRLRSSYTFALWICFDFRQNANQRQCQLIDV